jgi:chromosome segregation ATPase
MSEGNGTDLGHLAAMISSVLVGQEASRRALSAEIAALRADQNRRLDEQGRRLDEQGRRLEGVISEIASLREALDQYHGSVMAHGMLLTEHDERLRRLEQHLGLPHDI